MGKMQQEDDDRINRAMNDLGEHFDTVQIFCTRHEPAIQGGTVSANAGTGHWFARFGQIQLWVEEQKAIARARALNEENDNQ